MTSGPVVLIVSRKDVEKRDTSSTLNALRSCFESSARALALFENLDIAFDGYDQDAREVFEIPEVREYVGLLDDDFPYWLFFLSKEGLGLQAITLSLMPPYLTDAARKEVLPKLLDDLLEKRWFPAMNQMCTAVGFSKEQIESLTRSVADYFVSGPRTSQAPHNR
jgi:hypothetical protein